ncbi:hypothetical protein [Kitasatospora paracochleata]|uniref:4Fe-4S Wbl-type domain-containing protein n=1 Tax=Kitasatospora paracochleata TaxID=58354 RepID=A0ABT1J9A7_9ACTN|nr:hypothetical protein [Kitasatospora paracochleata]MCP2314037.1 hypothetical protein [Kitasatospora paracochleata]
MTTSPAIPTAQPRKPRTRTKNVSCWPAIIASALPSNLIELTPGLEHLACPDCNTWCPITTDKGSKQRKLVPHHTRPAGTPGAHRCRSSNRLVNIDLSVDAWQQKRADANKEAASRRPTTVLKKVKAPAAPAITQLDPAPATADSARKTYETHRARCAACTGRKHCQDGEHLAADYLRLLRREPERRRIRALYEEVQAAGERARARQLPTRRAKEWANVEKAVANADAARKKELIGARSPILGADVPTDHEDTKEQARALAQARTEKAIREASPIKRNAA